MLGLHTSGFFDEADKNFLTKKIRCPLIVQACNKLENREYKNVWVGFDVFMQMKNVLLVEDNIEIRDLLCKMLDHLGYSTTAVGSAEEALVHLETQSYPVLLADVVLPGMSGTALAERVHASAPTTRIILTTGQGFLLSDGLPFAFTLVPKPFHIRHIEAALIDAFVSMGSTLAAPESTQKSKALQ
ncbi:response regulator [Noviherbaspirillum malthae]|jgi:CheY-like chemotaxis protein|uniref:response regulator n=1 Tax=Noviherbaspirillum malthae TaxID=1260987 RepID=UPI00188E21A9|nr:response regulator [Noviherbaspirillum malthae]